MSSRNHKPGRQDWETPQALFDELNAEYNFGLDAAANERNHKCDRWLGPGGLAPDALAVDWDTLTKDGNDEPLGGDFDNIWVNPPFNQPIKWLRKAYEAVNTGQCTVVMLLPVSLSPAWFRDYASGGFIRVLTKRLRFEYGGEPFSNSADFDAMIVELGGSEVTRPREILQIQLWTPDYMK